MRNSEEKQVYVHVLVTQSLKEELIKEANSRQLSIASYVRQIILDRKKPNNQ